MKRFFALLSALLVSVSLLGTGITAQAKDSKAATSIDELEVHFIDVGQGDATLIKCGDSAMLIDAGENDKGTLVQNYLRKQGVKKLDYLIITHQDSDHCGGADVIITKYDIDKIIYPDFEKDTRAWRDVTQTMDYRNYKVTAPKVGRTYSLGDAEFTIIAPNSDDYGDECNNYSVGILLTHGDEKFIFTGDAEEAAEADILKNGIDIDADVLQVGHHGSRTASTQDFIKAVSPKYAVISCGENNEYGHPHAETLNTLRANNVQLFRTDEQGSLIATSDGRTITWNAAPTETWKAGEPTQSGSYSSSKSQSVQTGTTGSSAVQSGTPTPAAEQAPTAVAEPEPVAETAPVTITETAPAAEAPVTAAAPSDDKSVIVHITKTGKKYHNAGCASLSKSDIEVTLEEAEARGLEPCKKCH